MSFRVSATFMATLLLSGLSLASNAWAQAPPRTAKPGVIAARGAFFALSVADLDASSRWYTEKLGLEVVMSLPKANGIAVKVLGGGGLTVELIQQDGAVQASCGTGEPACLGMFKAGVLVKDLDKTLKSLAARGVQPALGPFPARPDQPANAIIRDNAGNLIQILEDSRPQSGS